MGGKPSMPVPGTKFRVIGAGMSRTGTKSFTEALTILLDAPVHDAALQTPAGPPYQRQAWAELMSLAPEAKTQADNQRVDELLAKLMEGYCASVDVPANLLTPELLRVFPNAIVIATTRDASGWFRSTQRMEDMVQPWPYHLAVYWIPLLGNFRTYIVKLRRMFVWRFGHWKLQITDLAHHEDFLRQVVPQERLFWVDCREGWAPLCRILDVPVPDRPFPHNNRPEDGVKTFRSLMLMGIFLWAVVLGITTALAWGVARYLLRA